MNFLEKVRAKRQKLADVLADDEYSGIREIVEELYPDKAHFIYELLQNAEDADATEAGFVLDEKSLKFEHNGRPFDEDDVWGITNIGKGTKKEQQDKIGRFGVGFKSVFAYSETPHIWSPTFAFKITDLVLPWEIESTVVRGNWTRFKFPFDNPKNTPNKAYPEVEAGLNELAETTLLFLSHLESIRWQNATGKSGEVLRYKHSDNHFEILKQSEGKTTASSHFLKFYQPVAGLEKQQVAIAYPLDFLPNVQSFDPKKPLAKQLKIIPAIPGRVAVFFPAAKETSGLRFHLHAPFVPELSRASIKETDANKPLFHQLAMLTAVSLHQIRDLGLLTADFLSVLPNPQDQIPQRYEGIRIAIIEEMNEQPLTPTNTKSHAPAKHLLQAKASLKGVLSTDDIEILVDYDEEPPQWAVARALQGTNTEKFMSGLAITDWDVEQFVELLQEKAVDGWHRISSPPYHTTGPNDEFMAWLSSKPVDWHQELYALLYSDYLLTAGWQRDQCAKKLKSLRIVLLSDGHYSVGTKCFFPSDGVEHDEVLPRVDKSVYTSGKSKTKQESAKKLLEELGVHDVGEAEQVEAILKQRYVAHKLNPKKGDLKRFISLLAKEPDKANLFTNYCIFERKDGEWRQPSQAFLDLPFMDTGLSAYYDTFGEKAKYFALADSYKDCGIEIKKLVKFAETVGVRTRLEITATTCRDNPDWRNTLSGVYGKRSSPVNKDYVITGLDKLPVQPSLELSKLVWNTMRSIPPDPNYLRARYQHNNTEGYTEADSQLVHQLRKFAWIPQGDGAFVLPAEALRDLLPEGFSFDPGWLWLDAIHFGHEAVKKSDEYRQKQVVANELGHEDVEHMELSQKATRGLSKEELKCMARERELSTREEFPEKSSPDPERRRAKMVERRENAPAKEKVQRERSIEPGLAGIKAEAKAYLRSAYTNGNGKLICQCCRDPMPFKLPSTEQDYFEAVQFIKGLNQKYYENYLALCPTCAAKYQHACTTSQDEIRRQFLETGPDGQSSIEVQIESAGSQATIRFVGAHSLDLKVILGS